MIGCPPRAPAPPPRGFAWARYAPPLLLPEATWREVWRKRRRWAAPTLVNQTPQDQSTAASPWSVTIPTTVAGNCLVALIALHTGATQSVSSISGGGTWSSAGAAGLVSGSSSRIEIWVCPNCSSVSSVSITLSTSIGGACTILEFSGVALASPVDQYNSTGITGTAVNTNTTPTTTGANDAVVGGISWTGTTTVSAMGAIGGTTGSYNALTGVTDTGSIGMNLAAAYQLASSAGTFGIQWTQSGSKATGGAVVALLAANTLFPPFPPALYAGYRM